LNSRDKLVIHSINEKRIPNLKMILSTVSKVFENIKTTILCIRLHITSAFIKDSSLILTPFSLNWIKLNNVDLKIISLHLCWTQVNIHITYTNT